MSKDIRIIPLNEGEVTFEVHGALQDSGAAILQRLYVLMFTDLGTEYRGSENVSLLAFLEGGNIPSEAVVDAMLAIACASAVESLDQEDKDNVESFTGVCEDGTIICTLELVDGTTVKGTVANGH